MGWHPYDLDRIAQDLVMKARDLDAGNQSGQDCFKESQKMRTTAAYGLERFWGEYLRYQSKGEIKKAQYWKHTWYEFRKIMEKTGINLPTYPDDVKNTEAVREKAKELWRLDIRDQRASLAVLTQFCDCLVWWTQRLKPLKDDEEKEEKNANQQFERPKKKR
jgi:hypothetical protein